MLLFHPVTGSCGKVPHIFIQLPQAVAASGADDDLPGFQQIGGLPDTGKHIIDGLLHPPPFPAKDFQKACRRRIHDDGGNGPVSCQMAQGIGIFPVGHLSLFPAGVKVEFLHPVPNPAASAPEPHGRGIDCAVVAGNVPFVAAFRRLPYHFWGKEIIDPAFRLNPQPQNVALVKCTVYSDRYRCRTCSDSPGLSSMVKCRCRQFFFSDSKIHSVYSQCRGPAGLQLNQSRLPFSGTVPGPVPQRTGASAPLHPAGPPPG